MVKMKAFDMKNEEGNNDEYRYSPLSGSSNTGMMTIK
jgi:hypothetical protein